MIKEHGQDAVLDSLVVTDQSSIHVFSGLTIHTEVIKITADFQYLGMPIPRLLFLKNFHIRSFPVFISYKVRPGTASSLEVVPGFTL